MNTEVGAAERPDESVGATPATGAPAPPNPVVPRNRSRLALLARRTRLAVSPAPAIEPSDPLALFPAEESEKPGAARRQDPSWVVLIAILAVSTALVEGAYIGRLLRDRPAIVPTPGVFRVASLPAGIDLWVDGKLQSQLPINLELPAGRHEIELRPGVSEPDRTDPALNRSSALELSSDPPGVRVVIDGQAHGITPVVISGLSPGAHDVALTKDGMTVRRAVHLTAGGTTVMVIPMIVRGAPQPGWVRVESPVALELYADGRLIGTSAFDRIMMPSGVQTLRLVNRALGYESQQQVQIPSGQTRMLRPDLPTGVLSINALPWAEVWVDGNRHGPTPIGNLSLQIGSHDVVLRHPEHGERRRTVTVTTGGITRVGVDLRQ